MHKVSDEDNIIADYHGFQPFYRLGVGLMIINRNRHVFVGQRYDMSKILDVAHAWQMPQGGIDYQEPPFDAALREMHEEIGTTNVRLIAESADWYYYHFPKELATVLWGGRYDGQKQKWYLFEFLGHDTEIMIDTKHPEFSAWRWVNPRDLPDLIVPFKRKLYEDLVMEFKPHLFPENA